MLSLDKNDFQIRLKKSSFSNVSQLMCIQVIILSQSKACFQYLFSNKFKTETLEF